MGSAVMGVGVKFTAVEDFARKWAKKFLADDTVTLAASLAFYTALSTAPLMVLFVAVSSRLQGSLPQSLIAQAQRFVGVDVANALTPILQSARTQAHFNSTAQIVGLGALLISAGLIFGQLRLILNRIFAVPQPPESEGGWRQLLIKFLLARLSDIIWALACILLLSIALLISHGMNWIGPQPRWLDLLELGLPAVLYFLVFSLILRLLPSCRVPWPQVACGAALTTVLFMLGKEAFSYYLGHSWLISPYGAAGSMIVLLIWVYYSSLILFIGAQLGYLLPLKKR
jgi:membrane protein